MIGETTGRRRLTLDLIIALVLSAAIAISVIVFFARLPIAGSSLGIDWRAIWTGLTNGQIHYDGGLRNPPWIALLLAPLGFLSFPISWGVINLLTLIVIFLSVPRPPARARRTVQRRFLLSAFFMLVSWPLLRQLADGNVEWLVIGGTLLIIASQSKQAAVLFALGLLLITAKAQEGWLLLIAAGAQVLTRWPTRRWLISVAIGAVVIVPTFIWLGAAWLHSDLNIPERGTLVDMSWQATANRINLPGTLAVIGWLAILVISFYVSYQSWRLRRPTSRSQAGALIAASLLLAPYSAGNSILAILSVGVIPLFQLKPRLGLALILLCDAPALMPSTFQYQYGADFATLTALIVWGILCRVALQEAPPTVVP